MTQATTAAEDRRFYSHVGVDPIAIARALKTNAIERRVAEGGSTLSQQVAKLLLSRLRPARRRGLGAKRATGFDAMPADLCRRAVGGSSGLG